MHNIELHLHPEAVDATFTSVGVIPQLTSREKGDLWDDRDGDEAVVRLQIPGAPQPRDLSFSRRPDRTWAMTTDPIKDLLVAAPEYVRGLVPNDEPMAGAVVQLFVQLQVPEGTRVVVRMREMTPAE